MYYVYYMLCAERLCELPLEVRVYIANMDMEAYIRMYLWDDEFKDYAKGVYSIDDFIERFVATRKNDYTSYKINNIEYHKYDDGDAFWYMNNELHRGNEPAAIYANGIQEWYVGGERHRDDGPAIIYPNGNQEYYYYGSRHRLNGPALIDVDIGEYWYINNKLHREDGPAIIYWNGNVNYWEYGVRIK